MKEEKVLQERINLLEKEITTVAEQIEKMDRTLRELSDLQNEIKGLKLFIGRVHTDFKGNFPEIMQKIYKKR